MTVPEALQQIKSRLQALYGERLKELMLYGSRARGDASPDSDIDILAVLEGPIDIGNEIWETVRATSELEMQMGEAYLPIHVMPVDASGFESGACGFYRLVQKEGIAL